MREEVLNVTGMVCDACIAKVVGAVKAIPGIDTVSASYADGTATVRYDEELASPLLFRKAIEMAGYGVDGATVSA